MDLDGDGTKDLISGNYVTDINAGTGRVYLLKGLGSGKFANPLELKNETGKPIIPAKVQGEDTYNEGQICLHPFAADWDDDGDLDLIIGNFEGSFSLVLNKSGGPRMKFSSKVTLLKDHSSKKLKCLSYHSAPFVIDWDGDGDLDLLSATVSTGLEWAENIGNKIEPKLAPFKSLISLKRSGPFKYGDIDSYQPGSSFRPWIADVNGDGKLDVLLGDSVELSKRADGLSDDEYLKAEKSWKDEKKKLSAILSKEREKIDELSESKAASTDEAEKGIESFRKAQLAYSMHFQKRSEFIIEKRTGHIWLYLAK